MVGFYRRNEKHVTKFLRKKFLSLRLKLTEKCNATFAKTQNGGKKLAEKCTAVIVFYFVGFHLNLTEKCNENFGKNRFTLDAIQNQFLSLLLVRPTPTTYLLKTATLL